MEEKDTKRLPTEDERKRKQAREGKGQSSEKQFGQKGTEVRK